MLHKKLLTLKTLTILLISLSTTLVVKAQTEEENKYYKTFPDLLTLRYYFSEKYTSLSIRDKAESDLYTYRPNTTLNMGIGATYKWATLNLAYGFGFLNPETEKGDTRYLDLQVHAYPRKVVIDVFGQFYKGYYLAPEGTATASDERFYLRPDMRVTKIGASAQYILNHEKFSYRAAFLQNEWQQKSAGSLLLGLEVYGGGAKADSAMVPTVLLQDQSRNFSKLRFFEIGPNAGYAYTLVIKRHVFLTASASANLGVGYTTLERDAHTSKRWAINPNAFFRGSAGYNSGRWSVSASYVHNKVRLASVDDFSNAVTTGNYRLNFVYRVAPGPKLQRHLRHIDRW